MRNLIGFGIVLYVLSNFPWLILVIVVIGIAAAIAAANQDANMTDEEKAMKRQQQQEYAHAQRMLQLEQEHQKQLAAKTNQHPLLTTVGKVGLSMLLHTLTNGAHRHRH